MSDDDIPDLAYSSGDDSDAGENNYDPPATKWLNYLKKNSSRPFQERTIRTRIMGPFLFGKSEQPEKWLQFCQEVNLLDMDKLRSVDVLSDDQLRNVELVEATSDIVIPQLFLRDTLGSILDMMEDSEEWRDAHECIAAASSNKHTRTWYINVNKKKSESDKVYMSIVFVCRQYVEHVNQYAKSGADKSKEFEAQFSKDSVRKKNGQVIKGQTVDQRIDEIKKQGNAEFQRQNFMEAISQYSNAVAFDYYNHVLYGNRAQAYLKTKQYKKALSDGKRAVMLKSDWAKGYYRYAQAFYELGRYADGLMINAKAREVCDRRAKDYAELDSQRLRFKEKLKESMAGTEKKRGVNENVNNNDDEVPDLVSPGGSSESDSDSEPVQVNKRKKTPANGSSKSVAETNRDRISGLNTLVCFKFAKESIPKNLYQLLKQYDSLNRSPPTIPSEMEKILIPDEDAIDHMTDYVHTGTFEWFDEKLGRSIECNRSADFKVALSKDSYLIDFSTWPRKLKLSFVPRKSVSSTFTLLHKSKRIFFHLHPKDTTDTVALLRHIEEDFVGDIVLPFNSESPVKRILCVFFPHRRLFMGVVPDEQRLYTIQIEYISKSLREAEENNRGREQTADEVIDDALSVVRNYTLHVWKGCVTWSKETLRNILGKWYPVGDTQTRSLECDVYGPPTTDWGMSDNWHKTSSITIFTQDQTKDLFEDIDSQCAVLKPRETGEGLAVLKELTSSSRNREGYIRFKSAGNTNGYMQIVFYEAMQVFMARWPDNQDMFCERIESLSEEIENLRKYQEAEKVIADQGVMMSKNVPKLVEVKPLTVSCENEFSGMSDSDDPPPLQSDDEEEEEQAKLKYIYKNLKKKDVPTKLPERLPVPVKAASSNSSTTSQRRDRSASKHKREEPKAEKKQTKTKSDQKEKTKSDQKENIKPEKNREVPKQTLDPRIVQLQERKSELQSLMLRGSEALEAGRYEMAIKGFNEVLDMFTKYHHDYFSKDQSEVMIVRYCLGKASVDTGKDGMIQEGMRHFQTIINTCKNLKFPLSYLGLGRAFSRQNRWELALPEFRRGLNIVIAGGYQRQAMHWPGSDRHIPETLPGELKAAFEEHIARCKNPPKPDAVCRYVECTSHYKIQIYLTDPDYKGYVRVKCFAQCVVEYHPECWKKMKVGKDRQNDKHTDKDLLSGPCFTPDCNSTIWMIIIIGENGNHVREITAPPENRVGDPKKVEKTPASSIRKISRKLEKKRIRNERKEEAKQMKKDEEENEKFLSQIDSIEKKVRKPVELEVVGAAGPVVKEQNQASSVNLDKLTMLKKLDSDSEDEMAHKVLKKSKKKKKQTREKKVITLGAPYYENENESAETKGKSPVTPNPVLSSGMDGLDDFGDDGGRGSGFDSTNPFSVPDHIRNEVEQFESSLPPQKVDKLGDPVPDEFYLAKNKDIKDTIFSLFAILLAESGPLHVGEGRVQDEIENFPPEARELIQSAGGVGHFLSKSLQFFHMDGYICLMKDAPKAQASARQNKLKPVEGQVKKPRTRVLPPDTRSRDQFPSLAGANPGDLQYYKNQQDVLLSQQRAMRESIFRRETSTPDSECTTSSDPLDNFFSAQLSQTLSQSSMDDREKTDVALATMTKRDSDASNNLYMPSAYGDFKSQESSISDSYLGGSLVSGIIPISSQASVENSDDTGVYGIRSHEATPPMTSPGLIHDIIGAKPLNPLSLADHPLWKAPVSNDPTPQSNSQPSTSDEQRNGDVGESPNREDEGHGSPVKESSPLPEARMNDIPFPHSSPAHRQSALLAPGPSLTPEQATITPPRPRNTLPKTHEPEFSAHGSMLPPHPDQDMSSTSLPATSMGSLISMPTTSLGNSSISSWMNTDIAADLGAVNMASHMQLGSSTRNVTFDHPSEIDEQLKQEIAEDVYNTMSQYSAFRDNPDLKKNILSDIEKDFQSSNEHGSLSNIRSFKPNGNVEDDGCNKAAQTEQDVVSRATNTEGDNYEALYKHAMLERNHMQAQLQDMLDKYTQLQKNSQVSVDAVLGQLEENRIQMQADIRITQETMQRMKVEHQAETQKLYHQLRITKELEESLTKELGDREMKIAELNRKVNEEQNNRLQMQHIIATYQGAQIRERDRAQAAEMQLLELKRDIGNGIMERSFKDAEGWIRNLLMKQQMLAQQKLDPPPHLVKHLSGWKETADKIKLIQAQSTAAFDEQIVKVRSGEQLCDLPVLPIPRPPAPPESLQGPQQGDSRFQSHTMGGSRPPGFGATPPRMPSEGARPSAANPAPASLATLASKSNLNMKSTAGTSEASGTGNTAEKQFKAKSMVKEGKKSLAKAEANTARVERQKNSFIKLMEALSKIFPNYAREDLDNYIKRLRSSRGGSLNGMGMDEIVTQVSDMIFKDQPVQMYKPVLSGGLVGRSNTPEIYDEEDPCSICHEEMRPGTTKVLECKHYFHDKCIRQWYREKNECPICRKYAPLDDEFPAL